MRIVASPIKFCHAYETLTCMFTSISGISVTHMKNVLLNVVSFYFAEYNCKVCVFHQLKGIYFSPFAIPFCLCISFRINLFTSSIHITYQYMCENRLWTNFLLSLRNWNWKDRLNFPLYCNRLKWIYTYWKTLKPSCSVYFVVCLQILIQRLNESFYVSIQ